MLHPRSRRGANLSTLLNAQDILQQSLFAIPLASKPSEALPIGCCQACRNTWDEPRSEALGPQIGTAVMVRTALMGKEF
jgi:hypothetical protein